MGHYDYYYYYDPIDDFLLWFPLFVAGVFLMLAVVIAVPQPAEEVEPKPVETVVVHHYHPEETP